MVQLLTLIYFFLRFGLVDDSCRSVYLHLQNLYNCQKETYCNIKHFKRLNILVLLFMNGYMKFFFLQDPCLIPPTLLGLVIFVSICCSWEPRNIQKRMSIANFLVSMLGAQMLSRVENIPTITLMCHMNI